MAFSLLAFTAQRSYAKCDPTGADAADIANARAQVTANCPCATATNHGQYVKCAGEQARMNLVNQSCRGAVVKCAAKSTCGKPNFVACCRTKNGVTKCSTKSSASHCTAPMGGSACASTKSSCCDACTASGCASPSGAFPDANF
jgi:hypothetical protein